MADTEKPGRKRVILTVVGVVAVLLIAAGAGFGLRLLQNKHGKDAAGTSAVGQPLPQAVNDAQDLRLQGNTAEADKKIDAALNDSNTPDSEKYLLYLEKGNGASDQKNYVAAADAYAKAAGVKETSNAYDLLGDSYAAAGEKDKAIDAYKKAITLVKGPVADDDKQVLENKIRNLGGSV